MKAVNIFFSALHILLKKTTNTRACKKFHQKIHSFSSHASKDDENNILCTFFLLFKNINENPIYSKIDLEIPVKNLY